jgi:hypothetical protein
MRCGRRTVPPSMSGTPQRRQNTPSTAPTLDDAQIAPERQLETASNSVAADGGNPRLLGLEARRSERAGARRLQTDGVVERTQVGARTERAVRAGEHADVHRCVGVNGDHRLKERVGGGLVDRVARMQSDRW